MYNIILQSYGKQIQSCCRQKQENKKLTANEEQLNDTIRLQVNQDYQNYLLSQKKIEVYQKAVAQATENYRITKNKYDNSLVTTTELLDADVAQLQAKLNLSFAKADAVRLLIINYCKQQDF